MAETFPGTRVGLQLRDTSQRTAVFAGATSDELELMLAIEPNDGAPRRMFGSLDAAIVIPIEAGMIRALHLAADAPITAKELLRRADEVLPLLLAGAAAEAEAREARLVTEHRKRIERRVLEAERKIAVADFASRIVHDLQQPLTAVGAYAGHLAGVLERLTLDPSYATRMRALAGAIESTQALARLLLFHALPLGESAVTIDLVRLARDAARLSQSDADRVGARVTITVTDEPCVALGRPSELTRVLLNLLGNACDAIGALERDAGGRIDIEISSLPSGGAYLVITDDGPGIPDASSDRVFEPFFSTKPPSEGTGLGLTIAREIVTAHGGTLTAQNVDAEGARFLIVLPPLDGSPFWQPRSPVATSPTER